MIEECQNCGCFNEPEPDGWSMNFNSDGLDIEMKQKCPVCGAKMEDA